MSVRAYFIGGQEDLTTRFVNGNIRYIYFPEKHEINEKAFYQINQIIECTELEYRLVTKTPNGSLVYEFNGKRK